MKLLTILAALIAIGCDDHDRQAVRVRQIRVERPVEGASVVIRGNDLRISVNSEHCLSIHDKDWAIHGKIAQYRGTFCGDFSLLREEVE